MREERKLNKAIERDGVNTQSEILEELKRCYPQYVKQSEAKREPNKKRRIAIISSIAAVAASVAIVVPCAVLLPNKGDDGKNNDNNSYRYCSQNEYSVERYQYTLREYSETRGGNILYFDWYGIAEECFTTCYTSNVDNEILCVEEYAFLVDSEEAINFSVTKSNVYLSKFDATLNSCKDEKYIDNHTVKWSVVDDEAACIFEDNGYRYFIRIDQGQDENRLFELAAELLGTK